ncbi:LPS export ABC transporter periplasmic protein LptC [Rhodoplanes sp. TEM]|uniref:LPS export ABC transporter periplasmic protein LptC n=1 Tax=Rhodoplanes tepidamans TaxID=200616 RepID=A0ABT5J3J7_RHOTP|nr:MULTISPECIES: LPS export ABC transporter periplasmic protein LptC [Rhodoplanes]MDC7784224.1 LPS export ABC transporter periplasmic protein LptC [Rhodoplanes tepidamans]MDC7988007.1 LPS export ABC transporter periplasmic protein LptC [Rhodoplanes sp. TEM]MDQ0356678.1 lipopolysaccharide export system protein LptC [Rhodoplanes tepidamans]
MNHLTAAPAYREAPRRDTTRRDAGAREDSRARLLPANDSDRRFRKARRHSRFIRIMRIAIPAGIVAVGGVLVVAVFFNPFQPIEAQIDPGKLVVSGTKITMELPRLAGFTADQKPYELTAQAASQDLTKPSLLELKELKAQVQTDDQGAITVTAVNGLYDTKQDNLKLTENILVRTGKGFEARLQEAVLDVKKGTIVSEQPVAVRIPNGTVDANRLDISDGGSVVRFSKGVLTTLNIGADLATIGSGDAAGSPPGGAARAGAGQR